MLVLHPSDPMNAVVVKSHPSAGSRPGHRLQPWGSQLHAAARRNPWQPWGQFLKMRLCFCFSVFKFSFLHVEKQLEVGA